MCKNIFLEKKKKEEFLCFAKQRGSLPWKSKYLEK